MAAPAASKLYVEEHGEGEPLLLIEGLGQSMWAWREQIPVFARRFRTIAYDTRGTVRSLVLVGTGAGGPERVPRPDHVREAFAAAQGLPPEEFGRLTMPYTLSAGWPERHPERFEEILRARLEHPTPYETIDVHMQACYRYYAEGIEVERVDAPALVIHGDEDLIVPVQNGRMLAARLPKARYVELPGRGHNIPLEDPKTFNGLVLEFLS